MRRTHLRKHENILKRQLVHVAGFNLSLIFRKLLGAGTPREWKNRGNALFLFRVALFKRCPQSCRPCRSTQFRSRRSGTATPAEPLRPRRCRKSALKPRTVKARGV
jgi:hypothetical protein